MLQGQGDGGPTRKPKSSERSQTRAPDGSGMPDGVRGAEARPTPLPKVNFTLLGLGPSHKSRARPMAAPPSGALPPRAPEQQRAHERHEQHPAHAQYPAYEQREQYPAYEQSEWYQAYEQAERYEAYEQAERYPVYEQPAPFAAYEGRGQYTTEVDDVQLPSDAELEALLRRVDTKSERTIELAARPVRPPWWRGGKRRTIWAGVALYLAVGSASFLWFAQRAKKAAPDVAQATAEPIALAAEEAPAEPSAAEQASAPAASAADTESEAQAAKPVIAPAPRARKAERPAERRIHKKKGKRAKQLAARVKRKKRAARAAEPY